MPIMGGKKQLEAASLEELGSNDRGDKVTLGASAQVLVNMADYLITQAENNLNKSGAQATGELESSMSARDIEIDGSKMYLDIEILDRYRFTDEGVNGVENSQGSKYSFKTKRPSVGMKNSIKRWLRIRGNRAMKYKAISRTERRDQSINRLRKKTDSQESLAWAVSTSIKKKGIKKTKFFTNAVKATERQFRSEIARGFKIDIINSLKDGD